MRIQEIYERSIHILSHPEDTWNEIKDEQVSGQKLFLYYALPFSLLIGFASFFGLVMFGPGPNARIALPAVFLTPLIAFLSPLAVILSGSLLAKFFSLVSGLNTDFDTFLKILIYMHTPVFLCNAFASVHWSFAWVMLFGLYSLYLLWSGIIHLVNAPSGKKTILFVSTALVYLSLWMLILFFIQPVGVIN